jgi:hypothetical protein
MRGWMRGWMLGAVGVTLAGIAALFGNWYQPATGSHSLRSSASAFDLATDALAAPVVPGVPSSASEPAAALSPPASLSIPTLGISTALQPLGLLADGSLQSPSRWDTAGWFDGGVVPGQVGPAVIAGHIDSTQGPAIFYRLRELTIGAPVLVTERDGTVLTFVVDTTEAFAKSQFPTGNVYGPTPDAELKLITCTGTFDPSAHSYRSNLVVTAHLTATT